MGNVSKDYSIAKGQSYFCSAAGEMPASISSQNGQPRPRKGMVRGFVMSNSAVEVPDLRGCLRPS